ncbi:hypothetical protein [Bradyrhizobium sp. Rc2d]|uniref:hypothetical protein n=1 Tax=Bradyrhizobium sp. Rc2d TaxID=1855321 RepID=UPI00115FBA33|nr:hypothetical protein [Bradyrhizobium sp. Rc2d]
MVAITFHRSAISTGDLAKVVTPERRLSQRHRRLRRFFTLGQVFTADVTGNVVLAAIVAVDAARFAALTDETPSDWRRRIR